MMPMPMFLGVVLVLLGLAGLVRYGKKHGLLGSTEGEAEASAGTQRGRIAPGDPANCRSGHGKRQKT